MSAPDMTEKLAAIRARHAAASRGPWRWFGWLSTADVVLQAADWEEVMSFVPMGAKWAQPCFTVASRARRLSDLVTRGAIAGSEPVTDINHPDARFIAASWEDVRDLLARVDELEAQVQRVPPAVGPTVWQYVVRNEAGAWLADVVLRSDGSFFAISDWGGYGFRWLATGSDCFRSWAAGLSPDYVASKLGMNRAGERWANDFARHVWPALAVLIRAELAAERHAQAAQEGGAA